MRDLSAPRPARSTPASPMPTPAIANDLVGRDTGTPLDPALFLLPGDNLSNAPGTGRDRLDRPGPAARQLGPDRPRSMSMPALTDDYNTGSDLFPEKEQDSYRARQRPPRHSRAAASAGRSSSGRRTCSTRIISRSRSTRRSRARTGARHRRGRRFVAQPQLRHGEPALLGLPRRAADLRHHRPLPLLMRKRSGTGPSPATAGAFSVSGGLAARAGGAGADGLEQPRLQRLQPRRALDLLAVQIGQIEDVDRALAIGGDMGAVDRRLRLEERAGQLDRARPARSRALTSTTV